MSRRFGRKQRSVQPRLMNEWGCEFFGKAESDEGDVWYYMGGITKRPLLPMDGAQTDAPRRE